MAPVEKNSIVAIVEVDSIIGSNKDVDDTVDKSTDSALPKDNDVDKDESAHSTLDVNGNANKITAADYSKNKDKKDIPEDVLNSLDTENAKGKEKPI